VAMTIIPTIMPTLTRIANAVVSPPAQRQTDQGVNESPRRSVVISKALRHSEVRVAIVERGRG
jgi:hypothetical protein